MNINNDMRHACRTNSKAVSVGLLECLEGVSLREIDTKMENTIREAGCIPAFKGYHPEGTPCPFPATACISVNDVMVHGVPNDYVLKNGDIVTVDVGSEYNGWFADTARTTVVGANDHAEKLAKAAESVLFAQIEAVRDGVSICDLIKASEKQAELLGVTIMSPWCGHGIGEKLHDEPLIPASIDSRMGALKYKLELKKYERIVLRAGQTICLEPVISYGEDAMFLAEDGWSIKQLEGSLTAHEERCVLVTEKGFEILS